MSEATSKEFRTLRGKTIECISLMGQAVGKARFAQDAGPLVELLLEAQKQDLDPDDPQVCFMIGAWANICRLMGAEMAPLLPLMMPQIMKAASLDLDLCVLNDQEAEKLDEETWDVVKVDNDQNFAMHTSSLEEKSSAMQMLVTFARELKEAFYDYCEEVLKLMLKSLDFVCDEIRQNAADALPHLLYIVKLSNQSSLVSVWDRVFHDLFKVLENEDEVEVLTDQIESLAACVEVLGSGAFLTEEQINQIKGLMERFFEKNIENERELDMESEEEEELADEKEEKLLILAKVYDLNNALFKVLGVKAVDDLKQLIPYWIQLSQSDMHEELKLGLCFWGDLIQYGGDASWQYKDHFMQVVGQGLSHEEKMIRVDSVYAAGLIAMYGPKEFSPFLKELLPWVIKLIETADGRSDELNFVTENAISCMAKFLKYRPEIFEQDSKVKDEILTKWLDWLPVWEDLAEIEHVYNYLCDLVEANNPIILGPGNSNLPKICVAIVKCIALDGLTPTTGVEDSFESSSPNSESSPTVWTRCLRLIEQMQSNNKVFSACLDHLTLDEKEVLQRVLI
ncbi:Importin-5 [Cichlidogyrus casuarinus]|uniref:Importin-5 n=1 Tax=Cichlidogyrus casuarinus TaxID=1844966 RepID=A0ABD2PQ54_9PLAT